MTSLVMRSTAKVDGTDGGRGGPLSCYPVSPWGVREQATSIRGGGVTLDQLVSQVQRDHRGAGRTAAGTGRRLLDFDRTPVSARIDHLKPRIRALARVRCRRRT